MQFYFLVEPRPPGFCLAHRFSLQFVPFFFIMISTVLREFIKWEPWFTVKLWEETLKQNVVFSGKIIRVRVDDVRLENGRESKREVVEHPGGVSIAALTENNELLMVRQFRYAYGKVITELPAGKLEKGEDPFDAIRREQMEETGTTGENYIYLGDIYPTPGYCNEIIRLWACRIASYGNQKLDEGEFLEVDRVPLERAVEMVMNNEIEDSKTQIGILKTAQLVRAGKL